MRLFVSTWLISFLLATLLLCTFYPEESTLRVKAIGNPDSYGNVIVWFAIYQWNGTQYVLLQNVTTTTTNWTQRVEDSQPINFTIKIRMNKTLADSEAQAVTYTQVYMNITGVWTNQELNNTATSSDATYYYCIEEGIWNQTGYPQAGVTYDVVAKYEAYY